MREDELREAYEQAGQAADLLGQVIAAAVLLGIALTCGDAYQRNVTDTLTVAIAQTLGADPPPAIRARQEHYAASRSP